MPIGPIEQFVGIIVGLLTILAFSISAYGRLDDLQEMPEDVKDIKSSQEELKESQKKTSRNIEATQAGVIALSYRVKEENGFELNLDKMDSHFSEDKPPEDVRPEDYIEWEDKRDDVLQ